jgi:nicotinic acid phosphoribosyltransferase
MIKLVNISVDTNKTFVDGYLHNKLFSVQVEKSWTEFTFLEIPLLPSFNDSEKDMIVDYLKNISDKPIGA